MTSGATLEAWAALAMGPATDWAWVVAELGDGQGGGGIAVNWAVTTAATAAAVGETTGETDGNGDRGWRFLR